MATDREYKTFNAFWPHYLREHTEPKTRILHYIGTSLAILLLVSIVLTGRWSWLPLALVCGYAFAWVAHALIERNKPATFTYPLWSLAADFKMLGYALTGKLGSELERAGVE